MCLWRPSPPVKRPSSTQRRRDAEDGLPPSLGLPHPLTAAHLRPADASPSTGSDPALARARSFTYFSRGDRTFLTHRKHKGNSCVLASNNGVPTYGLIDAIWSIAVAGKVRTLFVIFPFACVREPDVQRDFITARSGLNARLRPGHGGGRLCRRGAPLALSRRLLGPSGRHTFGILQDIHFVHSLDRGLKLNIWT